ncbi:putative membrane protein C19orf24, partial [Clarias magur]
EQNSTTASGHEASKVSITATKPASTVTSKNLTLNSPDLTGSMIQRAFLKKSSTPRKKYGLLANYDDTVEMAQLESDEDDNTVYEAKSLRSHRRTFLLTLLHVGLPGLPLLDGVPQGDIINCALFIQDTKAARRRPRPQRK